MSERLQAIRAAQNESAPKITVESDADDDESSNESIESGVNGNESSEEENEAEIAEDAIEEVADEENHKSEQTLFSCEALGDFIAEEPDDLSFSKGDMLTIISMRADGWWKAEDQYGHKGMIPSSFLKVPDKIQKYLDGNVAASANLEKGQFWEKLRNTVKQSHHIEEAVTCMGALPVGFCHSSLKQLIDKDSKYSTEAFLIPKYNDSGLLFRDLHWSSNTNTLKSITTQLQRCVRLVALRQVCLPASGFEISSHHVRICLHDGSKVLSNIHTIRAKFDPKTPKIWTFAPKLPPNGSSLEEGTFFVRSNAVSPTIGVLFQLSLSFTKIATKETGEMSCGWVFMRLLDDSGLAVPNRNRILRIHGGVPFLNLNNSPSFAGNKNGPLKLFMNRGKTPRLVVSVSTLKRKYDQLLNFLPETLIGPISSIPLLVLYRKILADKLLKDRVSFDCTELVQSPFLVNFINAFEQPDVMDAFRKCWSEKTKKLKQSDSKDEENKKKSFQQLFVETAFLILHCNTLPGYAFGNTQVEKVRKIEIQRIMKLIKEHGPLAVAMSSDYQFQPLSVRKLSLDVIGQHCFPVDEVE